MNEHDDDVLIDEPLLSKPIKRYRLSMTVNKVEELKTVECRNGYCPHKRVAENMTTDELISDGWVMVGVLWVCKTCFPRFFSDFLGETDQQNEIEY